MLLFLVFSFSVAFAVVDEYSCTSGGHKWLSLSNYTGTYSFTDDADGSNPSGFTVVESANAPVDVVNNYAGHYKVLKIEDNDASLYAKAYTTFTGQEFGWVDAYFLVASGSGQILVDANVDGSYQVDVAWTSNRVRCYDGTWVDLTNITTNKWYHLSIYFNTEEDYYDVYIDGRYAGSCDFANPSGALSRLILGSGSNLSLNFRKKLNPILMI